MHQNIKMFACKGYLGWSYKTRYLFKKSDIYLHIVYTHTHTQTHTQSIGIERTGTSSQKVHLSVVKLIESLRISVKNLL